MSHIVYLALGTNLGQRAQNLRAAIQAFAPQLQVLTESAMYETEPWGYTHQPAFLNMALCVRTVLAPMALLQHLKALETSLGRTPNFRNGPRLIDLDILFYDDLLLDSPSLVIPHPRLQERAFVLVPLAEIAPNLMHPRLGCSVWQLAEKLDKTGVNLFADRAGS